MFEVLTQKILIVNENSRFTEGSEIAFSMKNRFDDKIEYIGSIVKIEDEYIILGTVEVNKTPINGILKIRIGEIIDGSVSRPSIS